MNKFFVCALCIALLFVSDSVRGQAVYGSIVGTVLDSSGAAVPNAKVTISDVGKGVNFTTVTNESGNYAQTHLIVGVYDVRVEANGFQSYVQKNVNVEIDSSTQVNAQLTLGTVGETVSVTGEAPLLKTEKSDVSDTMTTKTVMELPVFSRDVSRLYFLVPGVQATGTTAASEQPRTSTGPPSAANTGAGFRSSWMAPTIANRCSASPSSPPISIRYRN